MFVDGTSWDWEGRNESFFYISFYCTTSFITDYKYTYVTINGL